MGPQPNSLGPQLECYAIGSSSKLVSHLQSTNGAGRTQLSAKYTLLESQINSVTRGACRSVWGVGLNSWFVCNGRKVEVAAIHLQMRKLISEKKVRNIDLNETRANARFDDIDVQKIVYLSFQ